jgi:hypothetical protein
MRRDRAARQPVAGVHALFVTYGLDGPTEAEHAELCEQLAPAFAAFPGLASKTWLANGATGRYGGFYVFADKAAFDAFVASELFELLRAHSGLTGFAASDFSVETAPTSVTRGPVPGTTSEGRKL